MFIMNVHSTFSAAHHLQGYPGACKRLHGHNWQVRACFQSDRLDDIGMAVDFGVLKKHLHEICDRFDHQYLNDLPEFKDKNPTSETIAMEIFESLQASTETLNCQVKEVEIWESERSSVIYTGS